MILAYYNKSSYKTLNNPKKRGAKSEVTKALVEIWLNQCFPLFHKSTKNARIYYTFQWLT